MWGARDVGDALDAARDARDAAGDARDAAGDVGDARDAAGDMLDAADARDMAGTGDAEDTCPGLSRGLFCQRVSWKEPGHAPEPPPDAAGAEAASGGSL